MVRVVQITFMVGFIVLSGMFGSFRSLSHLGLLIPVVLLLSLPILLGIQKHRIEDKNKRVEARRKVLLDQMVSEARQQQQNPMRSREAANWGNFSNPQT